MAEGCANRTHRRPTGLPPVLKTGRGTSPLCPPHHDREQGNDEGAKTVPYVSFFTGAGRLINTRVSPIRRVSLIVSKYSSTVNAYFRLVPSLSRRLATVMLPCLSAPSTPTPVALPVVNGLLYHPDLDDLDFG